MERVMLGAVKGVAQSQTSLFRLLSRRWRPLAVVKRMRPSFSPLAAEDEAPRAATWIGAKRPRYAPTVLPDAPVKPRSAWSPWQWVK